MVKTLCSQRGGLGSIPGQGTRSHMLKLKILHTVMKISQAATKVLCATTKTRHSQISKFFFLKLSFDAQNFGHHLYLKAINHQNPNEGKPSYWQQVKESLWSRRELQGQV